MRKTYVLLLATLCIVISSLKAQVIEDFSDGDYTTNPAWTPSGPTDWIVNSSNQLQSNNTTLNSTFYISTENTLATVAQWEFYVKLEFNTSAANYVDVFLTASTANLTTASGYYVRIGNTADEISLYRTGNATALIDGVNGSTNTSNNVIRIKVTRDANNDWVLYRDLTGGTNYTIEGTVNDATFNSSAYFGFLVRQSTASFIQRHYFDDIEIKTYTPDITPPAIQSITTLSATTIDVLFNEPLDAASAETTANYVVNNSIGNPLTAVLDATNKALVHLTFGNNFPNAIACQLTVNNVKDIAGNAISNGTGSFTYFAPYIAQQYDVVIDEIMFDPTPQVGLPNNEWIELRNTSAFAINLQGWRIGDGAGISGPLPDFVLQPDSFVTVCTAGAVAGLAVFGTTRSVTSFPSLDNTGELLYVQDANGNIIHALNYNVSWHQNELKKDGGWTLEMIDTKNPCSGSSNWTSSNDPVGGTPGKKNSTDAVNQDQTAPKLLHAYSTTAQSLTLVFDEPLNASTAAQSNAYSISDGITIASAAAISPIFDRVTLQLNNSIVADKVYTVTVNGVTDCAGNAIGDKKTARFGIGRDADSLDIVINEILFNPPANGNDYVELYNRSNKIIDLQKVYIANLNTAGVISSITQLSTEPLALFPQEFIVVTQNPALVKANYITQNPDAFVAVSSMPSYNNDQGNCIILNAQGNIVDRLSYSERWHFRFLDDRKGVALERIDYDAPTNIQDNWHSAATSAGYGTPTYKNSQYRINDGVQGEVKLSPEIVSPDNDGQDDFATIDYKFPEPGYVANITIFDAAGRPMRALQKNALCGTTGYFRWDGLGDRGQQLPTGVYIVYTEIFNLKGKKKQFKHTIVVARRN
ncbi:MAG TPA: lamin tail domain-containing protein [Ferruginibacter sp.]|nr:lamin tail domain-containing protein [Ferruginibacter sp.]HMP19578.1 lamin tail domain-containing protein [Ferruginibacter sp.]